MTQTLYVPENWPLVWWCPNNSLIRMSCPACGNFSLACSLIKPTNEIRSLTCDTCGLTGFDNVQAAMNSWPERHKAEVAQDTAAHADAAAESNMAVAAKRNWDSQKRRARA